MIALIYLFIGLDLDYGWMQCSELAVKVAGKDLSIMHAFFENGLWLTFDMGNCHSVGMADSTHQFLQMKILPRKSTSTSQELQKMGMSMPRMWLMSWQLQR